MSSKIPFFKNFLFIRISILFSFLIEEIVPNGAVVHEFVCFLECFESNCCMLYSERRDYIVFVSARLSGTEVDDEDIEKFEEIIGSESKVS